MDLQEKRHNVANWLFNPFLFWGGSQLFWLGLTVIAIHVPIGYLFNVRFDGALDMHVIGSVDTLMRPVLDILIAWASLVICFLLTAFIFKFPVRLIDISGAVGLARIPMLLSVIPAKIFEPDVQKMEDFLILQGSELTLLIIGGFIVLLFFIWYLVMLFNAYKINSNLKGWKLWTGFISSVLAAEVVSIVILIYL